MDTIWVRGRLDRLTQNRLGLPWVGRRRLRPGGWDRRQLFTRLTPFPAAWSWPMGGSRLLRQGRSVGLAERFRLGTGGQRDARERGLLGWLTVEGYCYGFLAAARSVSGTKEIRRKKPSPSVYCPKIFHRKAIMRYSMNMQSKDGQGDIENIARI